MARASVDQRGKLAASASFRQGDTAAMEATAEDQPDERRVLSDCGAGVGDM